jgi:hypothetical protein
MRLPAAVRRRSAPVMMPGQIERIGRADRRQDAVRTGSTQLTQPIDRVRQCELLA